MYLYDKHDYAVRRCVDELVQKITVSGDRPIFLEIGSGFHARYTGDLLHCLFRNAVRGAEPKNVEVHLVDPALYGYYSQIALLALRDCFGDIDFRTHAEMWTADFAKGFQDGPGRTRFHAAFALETTTLMGFDAFESLHEQLAKLLVPGGYFLDVSEVDDRATSKAYKGLKIQQRSALERRKIAEKHRLQLVGSEVSIPAHATAAEDSQQMVGMLFRKEA